MSLYKHLQIREIFQSTLMEVDPEHRNILQTLPENAKRAFDVDSRTGITGIIPPKLTPIGLSEYANGILNRLGTCTYRAYMHKNLYIMKFRYQLSNSRY